MKKIFISLFVLAISLNSFSQTLSPAERKSLIDELRREILDSLKAEQSHVTAREDDSTAHHNAPTQPDKYADWKGKVSLSGYVEAYYGYDFGNPLDHNRPGFVYSYNRSNEFNVNLALVKLGYSAARVRANIALMAGTYSNANLATEPGVLKNIFEANVGIRIHKKKELWIDGGIFASHIGWESAIGKDCWNLTRSIAAENTPYYQSGVKLTYTSDNGKITTSAQILNGWQRIQRVGGSSLPSFGWQVYYKPIDKITLNSSSFIGTDKPDSSRQMRYFHDFYAIFQPVDQFGIIAGFDFGAEQKAKGSKDYNFWYTPTVILRATPCAKLSIAARYEYYNDKAGVIIGTGTANGFQTHGASLNLDVNIINHVVWRIEGKGYFSKDEIFTLKDKASKQNYIVTTALAVSF